jgi:hypothetical protein
MMFPSTVPKSDLNIILEVSLTNNTFTRLLCLNNQKEYSKTYLNELLHLQASHTPPIAL